MPVRPPCAWPGGQHAFRYHVVWSVLLVSWSSLDLFGLPRMTPTGCYPVERSRAEGAKWDAS